MSMLATVLRELSAFVASGGQLQSPDAPLFPESSHILEIDSTALADDRGRIIARSADLRAPADYAPRFEELLNQGLPWINVTCYGRWNGKWIVGIELPAPAGKRSPSTSLNYSGPPRAVIERGWNAEAALALE
jgi:hypothetical protein